MSGDLTAEQRLRFDLVKLLVETYRPQGSTSLITEPAGFLFDFVMAERAALPADMVSHIVDALNLINDNATGTDDVRRIIAEEVRGFARRGR